MCTPISLALPPSKDSQGYASYTSAYDGMGGTCRVSCSSGRENLKTMSYAAMAFALVGVAMLAA